MWVKFEIKFENKKQEKSEKKKRDRKCNRWRCGLGKRRITSPAAAALIKNGILRGSSSDHPDQVMVKKSIHPVRHLLAVLYQPHPRHCDRHYWMHLPCDAVISPLTAILAGSQSHLRSLPVQEPSPRILGRGISRRGTRQENPKYFWKISQKSWGRNPNNIQEEIQKNLEEIRKKCGRIQEEMQEALSILGRGISGRGRDPPGRENYSHEKRKRIEVGQTAQKQVLVSRTQTLINVPFNDILVDGLGWFSWVVI